MYDITIRPYLLLFLRSFLHSCFLFLYTMIFIISTFHPNATIFLSVWWLLLYVWYVLLSMDSILSSISLHVRFSFSFSLSLFFIHSSPAALFFSFSSMYVVVRICVCIFEVVWICECLSKFSNHPPRQQQRIDRIERPKKASCSLKLVKGFQHS